MSLGWSSEVQWPMLLHVENVNAVTTCDARRRASASCMFQTALISNA